MFITLLDKAKDKFAIELLKIASRTATTTAVAAITKKAVEKVFKCLEGENDPSSKEKEEESNTEKN